MEDKDINAILERIEKLNKTTVDIFYNQLKYRLDNIEFSLNQLESFAQNLQAELKDIGIITSQVKDQTDHIREIADR